MGDVYIDNEISEMPLKAYNATEMNTSLLIDRLGFFSSMDDIFDRLLILASYIGGRFIQYVDDLALRDADRYLDLVNISGGQHLKSPRHGICKSFSAGSSSSSKPYISDRGPGICERRTSGPRDELLVDTRSEIVETSSSHLAPIHL